MIQSPKLLNASHSIRPYRDNFNTKGLYHTGCSIVHDGDELTDEQIQYLIDAELDSYEKPDIHSELSGDDYADAMMAELGLG